MQAMHLSSLLNKNLIKINVTSDSVESIYSILLDDICEQFTLTEPQSNILQKILDRDRDTGTVFPSGVAIPHVHLENYNDTIIAIAIPAEPLKTDEGEVKIMFLVISGTTNNTLYLHILQSIIKLSKDEKLFHEVLKSKNPTEFIDLITKGNFAIKRGITVGDLMSNKLFAVSRNTTLKELGNIFQDKNFGFCPVVDDNNHLIGEVTVLDLIMAGFPTYTHFLENMNFLKSFEPFEALLKEEKKLKVIDIMKKVECKLSPDDSIIEAVFLMNKNKRRDIPVVIGKQIVGIISFMDIFRKVIRG